jgi:glycosyltransferase involved in cell wall biosynthesis
LNKRHIVDKPLKNYELNLKTPHVTICVPAYNAARTIGKTIDSILVQDYPNYDVLVCDNLSSDDTAEIVKTYHEKGVNYCLNPAYETFGESKLESCAFFG